MDSQANSLTEQYCFFSAVSASSKHIPAGPYNSIVNTAEWMASASTG